MNGRFITFEGIDGAGKSTHIARIADRLRAGGAEERPAAGGGGGSTLAASAPAPAHLVSEQPGEGARQQPLAIGEIVLTREPGGTELAERLRHLVLHSPMDALTEVLLVFAARRDHLQRVIAPALARGATVLCDRFTDATFAYQGAGRGFDTAVLQQLESWVHGGVEPDLTFWFDLDPETAVERLARARSPDRFEAEGPEFFRRVRAGYRARAEAHPARFVRIDSSRERELVANDVEAALRSRGWW